MDLPHQSDLEAALTRWERHGRPGLPDHGFVLGRRPGHDRHTITTADGREVFASDDHILRMSPSPARTHIALQLAPRADEDAHLAMLEVGSGVLRRFPAVRCRYEPMLWTGPSTLALFARPTGLQVTCRAETGELITAATAEAGASRLFPGGSAGLVAVSTPGRATRVLDHATGAEVAAFPAVRRIAALGDGAAAVVDDGTGLRVIDLGTGVLRWEWDDPETTLTSWTVTGQSLIAAVVRSGTSRLLTIDAGRVVAEHPVDRLGAAVTDLGTDDGVVRAVIEAPTVPPMVVTLDAHGAPQLSERPPGAPGRLDTTWHLAEVDDGARVPVAVTAATGTDGPRPMILTCYGGFGVASLPTFDPSAAAWAECGGSYALAQVRGGGEHGRAWREAGRGVRKSRTIDDLIGAAESLIAAGLTRPDLLVLVGASHGGVIAASAGIGRPGLCAGVVSTAAPLDLLNLPAHPLGSRWISEFGTAATPEGRRALRAISPLHRAQRSVRVGGVPPSFLGIVLGEDSRVAAADTRALVTALTRAGADAAVWEAPDTGHGGNHLGRVHALASVILGFAAAVTGLRPPSDPLPTTLENS